MDRETWEKVRDLLPDGYFIATIGGCDVCGRVVAHGFWGWQNVECLNCGHERWVQGGTLQPT